MKLIKKYFILHKWSAILFGLFLCFPLFAANPTFTVVLDAGHGGHDPGALGSFTQEKNLNLAVVLDLGSIIEKNFKDVKVIYTRKDDRYLTLQERADVVNDNHADLFICIHTNSSESSSAFGSESFTLGLAKSKANLDVAMRENSVILLEKDYKTKYKGFDPTSVESYIMFEFMQDKYIDKSVELASIIQKQFVSYCNRSDRGVRQAGFWVLHRSACPSVLVEMGFISNPAEERYLSSNLGQTEIARAVYNAFVYYKRDHDKKSGGQTIYVPKNEPFAKKEETSNKEVNPPKDTVAKVDQPIKDTETTPVISRKENASGNNSAQTPIYKVQLFATKKIMKPDDVDLKGLQNAEYFVEGGLNKYTYGSETEYTKIEKIRSAILSKFPDAFIIAFIDGKKMSPREVLKLNK
ncbi:MAG: N-acetylmuramoyl-L-alanine amidase [Paludibacter sp.]|jgi:N-acetylmuramoyl-L-alanine amidase